MNEKSEIARRIQQLSSDYVWHSDWLPLGLGDLLSLFYWRTHSRLESHRAYYQSCLEALGKALGIAYMPLGQAIHYLPEDPKGALILLTDVAGEAGQNHEDALARRYAAHALLRRRDEVIDFMRLNARHMSGGPGESIQDVALGEAIACVYFDEFEDRSQEMGHILLSLDQVLHTLLLNSHPTSGLPLATLVADYGYPNPHDVRDEFRR